MKEIDELNFPKDRLYTEAHIWMFPEEEAVKIGISDYAQDQLGDVVFVELPETGTTLKKGDVFGTVESVKSVSELYMPIDGSIVSINTDLEDRPELVNASPYAEGWMMTVAPENPSDRTGRMDADAYLAMLKGSE